MNPDRWRRIEALVEASATRDGTERAAFLAEACGGDADLRREVESLLAEQPNSKGFLATGAWRPPALAPGTKLGPHEILGLAGSGGMGEVYKARDTRLDRIVALKVLPPEVSSDPERRSRFTREAKTISQLNHPHICVLHDIGEAELPSAQPAFLSAHGAPPPLAGAPRLEDSRVAPAAGAAPSPVSVSYLVMEFLEGETLAARLAKGPLPLTQALEIGAQIADALSAAHKHGVVHRDLKPGNVMLTKSGAKLLDFGLAKLRAHGERPVVDANDAGPTGSQSLTGRGVILGTLPYMAPEQLEGKPADARTDLWALGAILYEMLAGRRAFEGKSSAGLVGAILEREPEPLTAQRALTPRAVDRLVRKCLAKDPDRRWQSALDVAGELRWLASKPGRIRWRTIGLAAAAVLVVATLLATVMSRIPWRAGEPAGPAPVSIAVVSIVNPSARQDPGQLCRMLTSLLNAELSQSRGLLVVSSQRLLEVARQLGHQDATVDPTVATDVASHAGVATMVVGQVSTVGDGFVATVDLVQVESGRLLGSYQSSGPTEEDIFSAAQALGRAIRRELQSDGPPEAADLESARAATQSVEAYRAYVRGEARMGQDDYAGAAAEFRRAIQLDSEFALAYYLLSRAAGYAGDIGGQREAALRAMSLSDRLPPAYRDLLRSASLPLTSLRRVPLLESALERDPSCTDALLLLAEALAHSCRDLDPERTVELRERMFLLGSYFFSQMDEQAQTLAVLGRLDAAAATVAEIEARWPLMAPYTRAWLSAFAGRPDDAFRELAAAGPAPVVSQALSSEIPELVGRWDLAEQAVAREPGDAQWRERDLRARGHFLVYRGAFDRALEAYRDAVGPSLGQNPGWGGDVKASAFRARAQLEALRGNLAGAREDLARSLTVQPESPRWLFFAGRFAAGAGDIAAARGYLATLERLAGTIRYANRDIYQNALEAEIQLASGHPELALPLAQKAAESPRRLVDYQMASSFASPAFHDTLARTNLALGRKQDAARALERLVNSGLERVHHPVIYVRALYTLGTLRLELGDQAEGERLLRLFLDHWGQSPWDLPEVADARRRLAHR